MRAYIAGRLATAVLVILGVSVVSFFLTFLTGDPAEIMLPPGATAEQIEKFRREWGFDDPLPVQYWRFLSRAVHGDFGVSLRHGQPSLPLIAARLPATLQLTVTAMLLAIVLAVPLGVLAATHRGGPIDLLAMSVALVGQSVPNFWLAIMMILLFAVSLGLLPDLRARRPGARRDAGRRHRDQPDGAADAPGPLDDARGALRGLRADGARQGAARAVRAEPPRAAATR